MLGLLLLTSAVHPEFIEQTSPGRLAAWGALAFDIDGDGQVEVMGASHGSTPFYLQAEGQTLLPKTGGPWGELREDRHAMIPCDLDRDGQMELLVGHGGERGKGGTAMEAWFRSEAGWVDKGSVLFPMTAGVRSRGISCMDLNGDRWPEIFVASHGSQGSDMLLVHQADGQWVDQAEAWGLMDAADTQGVLMGDVNQDGQQDLVRLSHGQAEILQYDQGQMVSTEILPYKRVRAAILEDFDGDGDADLLLGRADERHADAAMAGAAVLDLPAGDQDRLDFAIPEGCGTLRLLARGTLNQEDATFLTPQRETKQMFLQVREMPHPTATRGLLTWIEENMLHIEAVGVEGYASLNVSCSDQPLPLASAVLDPSPKPLESASLLLLNDGKGGFSEIHALPVGRFDRTVGVGAADMDLDGDLDIWLVQGPGIGSLVDPPDLLLQNEGEGHFVRDMALVDQGGEGAPTGMVWADLNGDRAPEAVVFQGEFEERLSGPARVWANPQKGQWMEVQPMDANGAVSLSAMVRVEVGGQVQSRLSAPAPQYAFNGTQSAVFGLGEATHATRVVVRWPSGARVELQDVQAGQVLKLVEPVALARN